MSLESHLRFLKQMNIKPNYSALSREFKMDRHTIKKKMEGLDAPPKGRRPRPSALDPLAGEIAATLEQKGVSIAAAYWYFKNEKGVTCSYSNFKHYARTRGLADGKADPTPHPLYETAPGEVLQCDWVESITLKLSDGSAAQFNLFSATLAYSRLHYFEFTETKTEGAFKRCLCHCLEWLGGAPRKVLTDNMSALVSVNKGRRSVHPTVRQFAADIGVDIRFCRVRTPQTKGKDECSNKFAKWLLAYDGRLASTEEIAALVKKLVADVNNEKNQAIGVPPSIAFGKEKEHLSPLPPARILREYESWSHSCKVPQTQLVYFRSARYSVPPNLITKTVQIEEEGGIVYIYHAGAVVAKHESVAKGVAYQEGHLRAALAATGVDESRIDAYIETTLSRFKELGGGA